MIHAPRKSAGRLQSFRVVLFAKAAAITRTVRNRLRLRPPQKPDGPPPRSQRGAAVALELERCPGIRMPADFRAYLEHEAPATDDMDYDGIIWWSPDRIRSLAVERAGQALESLPAEIEGEADSYLVFADYLDWCYAYALCCSPGPNRGRVAIIGEGLGRFVAGSFGSFRRLAAENSDRLHSPAGDHYPDMV